MEMQQNKTLLNEPTEEEKATDMKNSKMEYQSNMTKTYRNKNRGLDLKLATMEILSKRLKELDTALDSQEENKKLQTLAVMAELGKAIIPD